MPTIPNIDKVRDLVIITHRDDAHLPYVIPHLKSSYIIVDPQSIIHEHELSFENDSGNLRLIFDGIDLHKARGVWYRKPEGFNRDTLPVPSGCEDYSYYALQEHWYMLRSSLPNAYWLSDFYQMIRASHKPIQLQIARQVGFSTPHTLITSSTKAAKNFIDQHQTVIVKTLAGCSASIDDGQPRVLFATKLEGSDSQVLYGLHLAPAIFQQAIEPNVDIRVHVIGDRVLAATITGSKVDDPKSPVRDWKIAHFKGDMRIAAFDLPKPIADMCIAHTKKLGLEFGVIDLVLDRNGVYWFLENNPNGQWAFVEDATGQPIGQSIANLLDQRISYYSAK